MWVPLDNVFGLSFIRWNSGSVSAPATGNYLLIDNLETGFDLYQPYRTTPSRCFKVVSSEAYVKQGAFGEEETKVVCGSDHGFVYVFGIDGKAPPQKLRHGSGM